MNGVSEILIAGACIVIAILVIAAQLQLFKIASLLQGMSEGQALKDNQLRMISLLKEKSV